MDMELGGEVKVSPMSREQIFGKICDILHSSVLVPDNTEIKMASRLSDELGLDSLDLIDLNLEIDREFGIQIPDEDFYKLDTYSVGMLCETIEREMQKKAGL